MDEYEIKMYCTTVKEYLQTTGSIFCYAALNYLYKKDTIFQTNPTYIYKTLCGFEETPTKKEVLLIKDGLTRLAECDIIEYVKDDKDNYLITSKSLGFEYIKHRDKETYYFDIKLKDIRNLAKEKHPIELIGQYIYVVSTINVGTRYGLTSQKTMANVLGVSRNTLMSRNNIIAEYGLLYFTKSKSIKDEQGNWHNESKYYCKPMYKHLLDKERNMCMKSNAEENNARRKKKFDKHMREEARKMENLEKLHSAPNPFEPVKQLNA